jgi:ribosomal-protein-alanine N-acetyltransferase
MTEADVPAIIRIQDECKLSPWSSESYKTALQDDDFKLYTAKNDNEIAGFLAMRLITNGGICELLNIGILPTHQNKRIGQKLLTQLLTEINQKVEKITLEVREGNRQAIDFYTKQGFYGVGLRKNYYSGPVENALLMEKLLK